MALGTPPRRRAVGPPPSDPRGAGGYPSPDPRVGPGGRRRPAAHRRRGRARRRVVLAAGAILSVVVLLAAVSLVGAATTPGNQSFEAKWADWLRSHHAAALASALEQYYYDHKAPSPGGRPRSLNPVPATAASPAQNQPSIPHLPPPAPVPLVVSPALPGEGQWQPVGPTVDGIPAMYEAQFRADDVYTGEITTAVWIDPKLANISLIPGETEPGGTWAHPPYITSAELPSVMAAFNGGFRMADAQGGFYLDGRTAVPLRPGAASVVIYQNGSLNIGSWGTQVTMTPSVVAVLQNLVLMVDNGQVS